MRHERILARAVILTILIFGTSFVWAGDDDKKDGSLKVKDLPKPIPQAMDKIKEVGDEVGKGITKAAAEAAAAVNKAIKGSKAKDK
ncbi:MAG: hypothetical protein ACREJU_03580 [Nitrospiraceae bacterium]